MSKSRLEESKSLDFARQKAIVKKMAPNQGFEAVKE